MASHENSGATPCATGRAASRRSPLPLGCIFRNTRSRGWYWKGRPPGSASLRYIPLVPAGKKYATHARDVALVLARRLVARFIGKDPQPANMASIIEGFRRVLAVRSEQNAKQHAMATARFLAAARIAQPWEITGPAVQDYLADLSQAKAPGTVHRHKAAISRFCRYLRQRGLLEGDPTADLELPRVYLAPPRFLDELQTMAFLIRVAEVDEALLGPALVCLHCGLRLSEMIALRWADYDGQGLRIGAVRPTKTYRWRRVTVPPELAAWLNRQQRQGETLFPQWHRQTYVHRLAAATRGLPLFGELLGRRTGNQWHLLRSTWAVNRARPPESWTLWRLMQEGGWTNTQTPMRYINLVRASV